MGWLFTQVWVLCAVAFLAGAAVTWLVFVRPVPRPAHRPPAAVGAVARVADPWPERDSGGTPAPDRDPEPGPPRVVDPALSALDRGDGARRGPPSGVVASGALDELGVAGPGPAAPQHPPDIPAQAGPADGPSPLRGERD